MDAVGGTGFSQPLTRLDQRTFLGTLGQSSIETGLMGESMAAKDTETPSPATLHVGSTLALIALEKLAQNLAQYLAGVERVDGTPNEEGRECALRLLGNAVYSLPDHTGVTDLPRAAYDEDAAKAIAINTVGVITDSIRRTL